MEYAQNTESYNNVNHSALNIIPHIDHSYFDNSNDPRLKKLVLKLEKKLEDLKDISSIYEHSKFSTHLKAKELEIEIEQIKNLIKKDIF